MKEIIEVSGSKMTKAIAVMEQKFNNVRTGRANPAILDKVKVSYYGIDTPLKSLAIISVPEARVLAIKPFDRNSINDIEKAIYETDLGLTPSNNGESVIINFPPLTEERRKEYVKQVKSLAEEARISLRNIRQDANNSIKKESLPEDEEAKALADIQQLTDDYNQKIDDLLKVKDEELMTI